MADVFSKIKRSQIMAKISGKETTPEIIVRKELFAQGFRYRKNDKRYPGKPDIVLAKFKTIIFINGCFWHGHKNCKHSSLPSSNTEYWSDKINKNIERDSKNTSELIRQGWNVIVLWGCEIETIDKKEKRLQLLVHEIKNSRK